MPLPDYKSHQGKSVKKLTLPPVLFELGDSLQSTVPFLYFLSSFFIHWITWFKLLCLLAYHWNQHFLMCWSPDCHSPFSFHTSLEMVISMPLFWLFISVHNDSLQCSVVQLEGTDFVMGVLTNQSFLVHQVFSSQAHILSTLLVSLNAQ